MQLPPNTRLTLSIPEEGKAQPTEYTAYVLGMHPAGVRTTLPQILHQSFAPPIGDAILAAFEAGIKLAEFETEIMGYLNTAPPSMVIAPPREIHLRERRFSHRVRATVPITYTANGGLLAFEHTVTYDLSTGGLAMVTSEVLPRGLPLALSLELPKGRLELDGHVAWSTFKERYKLTGVKFAKVTEAVDEAITRFLFSPERLRPPQMPK